MRGRYFIRVKWSIGSRDPLSYTNGEKHWDVAHTWW